MTEPGDWAHWRERGPEAAYTLGLEEEVMLLEPDGWRLAQTASTVLGALSEDLARHVSTETHGSALELATGVHASVRGVTDELRSLRERLAAELEPLGLRAASAGTHPSAVWNDTVVSEGARHQSIYGSMRELARREPSFALHVHVGVRTAAEGIRLFNRMRAHLPLLLALSANSPFWQGRDTGLASTRTPLFGSFPRTGIPRAFRDYDAYVAAVDLLIRTEAFPEPTYLWWDVRPQPRFGTVEIRVMDAQTTVDETAALVALVQSVARLELEGGHEGEDHLEDAPEILAENHFLAARDGMEATLIDRGLEARVPARDRLADLLEACGPHAEALGCAQELAWAQVLGESPAAARQLAVARGDTKLLRLTKALSEAFLAVRGDSEPSRLRPLAAVGVLRD